MKKDELEDLVIKQTNKLADIYGSFDRFAMEQQIMSCWNITTDLKDLTDGVLEHDLSQDQIANALIGIRELYELRFQKLFNQLEQLVQQHAKIIDKQA